MYKYSRFALVAGAVALIQAANAQATFTLINATYTLDSAGPFLFNFIPDSVNMSVDFLPTAPAFKVGDSTVYGSGVGTIIYTVIASHPVTGINMTVQGTVNRFGEVNWTETAETLGGNNLGFVDGFDRGSSYAGGVDGAFTQTAHLSFSSPVTSFKVKKMFDIDIGANRPPSDSVSQISLIEQNLTVPEPTALAGLFVGLSALAARRRKK